MKKSTTSSSQGRTLGLVLLCFILCFGCFAAILSNSPSAYYSVEDPIYEELTRPKTAAELRAELLEKEQSSPSEYLDASGKYWRNLVDQLVVEGTVTNNASLAAFKDPVITVEWYSKTGTLIGEERFRLYEYVQPGSEVYYKYKMTAPAAVKSVAIEVTDATSLLE